MKRLFTLVCCLLFTLSLAACGGSPASSSGMASSVSRASSVPAASSAVFSSVPAANMSITSPSIAGGVLADEYGARGTQKSGSIPTLSIPITVQDIPSGTAALAVVMTDPDAGDFVHWLAVNLPANDIAENASITLAADIQQGKNGFGAVGYGGPTPPSGTHNYIITVYALSQTADLSDGFTMADFTVAISDITLAEASITGSYSH
ncbi:MAG: YbhB/YbcL family Raf kinase inhibitor-like protein [Oscillospiraceae bacterium]